MQDQINQETNSGVKIACGLLLVAIVVAAGVGLLVQHRKLDELRHAHADLGTANQKLVADRKELVSANDRLTDELRTLREMARARAAERATVEKERISWQKELGAIKKERVAWGQERERLKADVGAAQAAQARAEKELVGLKAFVKDLRASEKKLRDERDMLRKERDVLEHELNEAMRPAEGGNAQVVTPVPVPGVVPGADEVLVPVTPAPPLDNLTPEERVAHEKEELKDLTDL